MIEVIRSALASLSLPVYDSFVSDEEVQDAYVLCLYPPPGRGAEESLDGGPSQVDLIVRAVGVTPGQVRALLESTRVLLRGLSVSGARYRHSFHWDGSPRPAQSEQQAKTSLGTFPVWLDDEYTVFVEKE